MFPNLEPNLAGRLAALIVEMNAREVVPVVSSQSIEPPPEVLGQTLYLEDVHSRFPGTLPERMGRALLTLSRKARGRLSADIALDFPDAAPLFFAPANDQADAKYVLSAMHDAAWLKVIDPPGILPRMSASILPAGWNRVAQLESADVSASQQAFVAMWFGRAGKFAGHAARGFFWRAYAQGFYVGAARAGYKALRVDEQVFTGDVVARIVREIQASRLVIADFTGHRRGVYYEAGYAEGARKPLIMTCHERYLRGAHFDTRNLNHLLWSEPADLAEKLHNWIVRIAGRGPGDTEQLLKAAPTVPLAENS